MPAKNPEPVPFFIIGDAIRRAYCSACLETLGMGNEVGTPEEQQAKMESAFERHLRASHSHEVERDRRGSGHEETIRIRIRKD